MPEFDTAGLGWPDVLGTIGVIMILYAYAAAQIGRMRVIEPRYSLLNAVGALAILISLLYSFNLASFLIEIAWLIISLFGLYRALRARDEEEE